MMSTSFGPWATTIHAGDQPQLSAFWKRRFKMLRSLKIQTTQRWRRKATLLIFMGVFVLSVPTVQTAVFGTNPATERANAAGDPAEGETFNVKGTVLDPDGRPLADVDVRVYGTYTWSEKFLAKTQTDATGSFRIEGIPTESPGRWHCKVAAIAPDFASRIVMTPSHPQGTIDYEELTLSKPESIRGWVVGPDREPVSGAEIYTSSSFKEFIPGVHSAKTDAAGYFEIDDLAAWDSAQESAAALQRGRGDYNERRPVRVSHPDYGSARVLYRQVPASVFLRFDEPMVVTGGIVDLENREPVEGLQVVSVEAYDAVRTDQNGRYRLIMQPAEKNEINLVEGNLGGRTSFAGIPGANIELPDLNLYPSRN